MWPIILLFVCIWVNPFGESRVCCTLLEFGLYLFIYSGYVLSQHQHFMLTVVIVWTQQHSETSASVASKFQILISVNCWFLLFIFSQSVRQSFRHSNIRNCLPSSFSFHWTECIKMLVRLATTTLWILGMYSILVLWSLEYLSTVLWSLFMRDRANFIRSMVDYIYIWI